jgi:hypothetical protein
MKSNHSFLFVEVPFPEIAKPLGRSGRLRISLGIGCLFFLILLPTASFYVENGRGVN